MIEIVFWASIGLIVYAHVGYPLLLAVVAACSATRPRAPAGGPSSCRA